LIERLFALSVSQDAWAVLDCYAESKRREAGFDDFAKRWSTRAPRAAWPFVLSTESKRATASGPLSSSRTGESVGCFGRQSTFFSIGAEDGILRIYDAGTALASADVTRVSCDQ
jgi:hypothetical protein